MMNEKQDLPILFIFVPDFHFFRPIFNILLEETVANPSDKILRRILAFKKSLNSFESNVVCMENSIEAFLENDEVYIFSQKAKPFYN